MRSSALLALLTLSVSLAHAQAKSIRRLDGSKISVSDADAFARKTLADAHVTGAELAVLNNGHLVWSTAYGQRRIDSQPGTQLPMTPDTNTWAASITKSVFATYVMQLAARGDIDLDKPLAGQLKKPLNEYDAYKTTASALVNDPAWPGITPRMLLSHSSGLLNFAFLEKDGKMHLHFKPGSEFLYSGEGINLVQLLVEEREQKPLDQLMQQAIFTPLGMTHTGLIYRTEFAANVADRYDRNGKFIAQTKRFPVRAAGSMATSVSDLALFAAALLNGKLLTPAAQAEMLRPVLYLHSLHEFPLAANEPEGAEAAQAGLAYGVGWGLLTRTRYGAAFFKEGHGDGAQNYIVCFERQKSCMILLTNSDNGELAFRPLLEHILGDTVTPWEWEGYTPSYIEASRKNNQ